MLELIRAELNLIFVPKFDRAEVRLSDHSLSSCLVLLVFGPFRRPGQRIPVTL